MLCYPKRLFFGLLTLYSWGWDVKLPWLYLTRIYRPDGQPKLYLSRDATPSTSILRFMLLLALLIPFRLDAQTQLPMDSAQWIVGTCPGIASPASTGDGGIQFPFPPPPDCIGWFSFDFKHATVVSGTLTSNVTVQADPGVTFSAADVGNNGTTPCTTRIIIYARGWDKGSCAPGSPCASLRWYANSSTDVDSVTGANIPPTAFPLANGSATLSVPVSFPNGAHHWTNVYGEWNDADQSHIDAFNSAMQNAVKVHQGCGCGYFFEHGCMASGPATFKIYSYGWQ